MKINTTPIRKGQQSSVYRKNSPLRQNLPVSRKRDPSDFHPGLYITPKFNEEDIIAIKEAFDNYDSNKTGLLTPNDLKVALFHEGFQASKETIYNIIAEYDEQCLGGLNFAAFVKIITSEPAETQQISQLKKVFRKIDKENKGFIDKKDIQTLLKSLGQQWSDDEIERVLEKIDVKNRSKISFDDFCRVMHSPSSLN